MTTDANQTCEADLSAHVLSLLDEHLLAMQRVRDRMRIGSTTAPGARHSLALDSISAAERYAAALRQALASPSADRQ